ncbi:MAG: hypothetical protein NUV54_01360 [Candidatus Taylorbacteria bacterium]|nr:hypothetical protein [Candidatus Taylorbacteria bacterium]
MKKKIWLYVPDLSASVASSYPVGDSTESQIAIPPAVVEGEDKIVETAGHVIIIKNFDDGRSVGLETPLYH